MKVSKKDVPQAWLKAFPNYKGRKFRMEVKETVSMNAGYWSGGSKEFYAVVEIATGKVSAANEALNSPECYGGFNPDVVEIKVGFVFVKHSIFCGNDMGLTFVLNPNDVKYVLGDRKSFPEFSIAG